MRGSDENLERASLALAALATLALAVVLHARAMGFAWIHALPVFAIIGALLACSYVYRAIRPDIRVARLTFALATQIWASCAVGGLTMAALGWQFPLIDSHLAAADQALHIDTAALIAFVAHNPLLAALLAKFYVLSVGGVFAGLIALTLLGRTDRVAELGFLFVATIILCAVISIPWPAYGTFTHFHIDPQIRHALPDNAGVYYMPTMLAYRAGVENTIDLTRLMGVITFPSFHTCMALMVAHSFRGVRFFFWPVILINVAVGLSIIPIGGHYAIDIVGGAAVFAAAAFAIHAIRRNSLALGVMAPAH